MTVIVTVKIARFLIMSIIIKLRDSDFCDINDKPNIKLQRYTKGASENLIKMLMHLIYFVEHSSLNTVNYPFLIVT